MPALDGVIETALYVEDMDRSIQFYKTIFGFEVIHAVDRLCAMSVSDRQILLICKKRASATLPAAAHDGDGHLHVAFAIPASELVVWEEWLNQHGIPIEQRTVWDRGGISLYFRDPDGHVLEVATPGVWPRVY